MSESLYTKTQIDHALGMFDSHSYNKIGVKTGISKSSLIRAVKNEMK